MFQISFSVKRKTKKPCLFKLLLFKYNNIWCLRALFPQVHAKNQQPRRSRGLHCEKHPEPSGNFSAGETKVDWLTSDSASDMNLVLRSPNTVFDLLILSGGINLSCVLQPGNANTWFLVEGLVSLLGLLLCLPHGAETDLLNGMDRSVLKWGKPVYELN